MYSADKSDHCEDCLWGEVCDYYDEKYIERCKPELLEKTEESSAIREYKNYIKEIENDTDTQN